MAMKIIERGQERGARSMHRLWHDEEGVTSLEYALMLAIITLAVVAGYQALGGTVSDGANAGVGLSGEASQSASADATGAAAPG